jgi:hypothetical protein
LAVKKLVMALAGGNKLRIDIQFVTFNADLAVNQRATTGMIGETEGDSGFV